MTTLTAWGKFIHRERINQKLSLVKLSEKAFEHKNYANLIMDIEKNKKPQVAFDTIDKILIALGYELKDLFLKN